MEIFPLPSFVSFILNLILILFWGRMLAKEWVTARDTERGVYLIILYTFVIVWSAVDIIRS